MAGGLYLFPPRAQDVDGTLLPGALLSFYATGGLTPQAVYALDDPERPLGTSLRADSAGRFAHYQLDPDLTYRAILTVDGAEVFDLDPFTVIAPPVANKPLDDNGAAMPSAVLTFWLSRTTELAPVYSDSGLTSPIDAVQIADAAGAFVPIYLDSAVTYRVKLERADGTLVYDVDPIKVTAALPSAGGLFVLLIDGSYRLLAAPNYDTVIVGDRLDAHLGVFNGCEYGGGVLCCYGAFGEGSSAGCRRSTDGGLTFDEDFSSPLYSNAPLSSFVAYGEAPGIAGKFFFVGTRSNTNTRSATSPDAPDDAFSWTLESDLAVALGNLGCAGISFPGGDSSGGADIFYAYGNDGTIAMYENDTSSWVQVASGGPSSAYSHNSTTGVPRASFARSIATSPELVVGMFAGRIVVSADDGSTWDLVSYLDGFHNANIVGGRGFNNPLRQDIAQGAGAFVAVGAVDGVPRIRYALLPAFVDPDTAWPDAVVPTTSPPIQRIDRVKWDTLTQTFIAIGLAFVDVGESFFTCTFFVLQSPDGITWTKIYQETIADFGFDTGAVDFALIPADLS